MQTSDPRLRRQAISQSGVGNGMRLGVQTPKPTEITQ